MSKTLWTKEQERGFTERADNLLVAAAAGSGKTAVLVERILGYITDEKDLVDIDRLLVVTFTNAAAAEMRQRVGEKIEQKISERPDCRRLQRQFSLLNKANITTIHSFCLEILRQQFHRLNLDPNFRVADEAEMNLLKSDVLDKVLEDNYESGCIGFLTLVEKLGGERSDDRLGKIVLELYRYARSQPYPRKWLENAGQGCSGVLRIDSFSWCRFLMEHIKLSLEQSLLELERAQEWARQPGGPERYLAVLENDLNVVKNLLDASLINWNSLHQTFQDVKWERLPRCSKDVDENLKVAVQERRNRVKKDVSKLQKSYFSRFPEDHLKDIQEAATEIEELSRLVIQFDQEFQKAKLEKSLVDFSDLEHYALEILDASNSEIAAELKEQYREVLVDEYQDINSVQERILELISGGTSRFMVGDVKQSIYRFRLAEPGLFLKKFREFSKEKGEKNQKITLSRNFRSRKEILEAVNFIFKQIMTPVLGEIGYDQQAELVAGRVFPNKPEQEEEAVELHLIDRSGNQNIKELDNGEPESTEDYPANEEPREEEEKPTNIQAEARVIATRIKELVTGERPLMILDGSNYRRAAFRDIVILLRATRGWADIFMEELQFAGIPVYADIGTGYFDAVEVDTMISLLKIIDNPRQDIFLAGVLRSPLFSFTLDDLAIIRLSVQAKDVFTSLKAFTSLDHPLAERVNIFLNKLDGWRTKARRGSLADLIWDIYGDTGYYHFVGTMPGGSQRQANLRALYDRARQYEAGSYRGLFRFLRFIDRLQSGGSDLGTARALGENEDVVRIMSVHKSKGLEFPVVFVAGLGKRFNMQDLNGSVLMHKELGLGLNIVDMNTRVVYPTLSKLAIRSKLEMEALAEEMRIFYVALTRAKEKLILVGSSQNLEKSLGKWAEAITCTGWYLPDSLLAQDRSWLDWLGRAIIRHNGGELLRERIGLEAEAGWEEVRNYPCGWLIKVSSLQESEGKGEESDLTPMKNWEKVKEGQPVDAGGEWTEEIAKRLNWQYPWKRVTLCAAKTSVTGIRKEFAPKSLEEESRQLAPEQKMPSFLLKERDLSAAEKGTALHLVMQHLDFSRVDTLSAIKDQVEAMVLEEIITSRQADAVDVSSIAYFFTTPFGIRIRNANQIIKELPFTLALPAKEIYPDLAGEIEEEVVLIQGVIDLVFQDNAGWVIVDYKTGQVNDFNIKDLTEKYHSQLDLYARALSNAWKCPVSEKYVYFFSIGKLIMIN
ncbi:MAG: helicase-exonuclease AddAB subunit AddA [Desulfitobacteriaceae bacterium]|nr:helicase-exonuclease AddAB subunit AddA [Desulfitobacteriaceae bacterium]